MRTITSRTNPHVKEIVELQQAKVRNERGLFCAEGLRTGQTLSAHLALHELFVTEQQMATAQQQWPSTPITLVTEPVMAKISQARTPSGIVGVFALPKKLDPQKLTPGLALTNLNDPGNVGTLIRTAAALGVRSIVCIEGADPWQFKAVQASAGTISMVTIFRLTWKELVEYAQRQEIPLCALVIRDGAHPQQTPLHKSLLVVGSEAHGLTVQQVADCAHTVTLPMPGGTESLNAATAGSVALYLGWASQ